MIDFRSNGAVGCAFLCMGLLFVGEAQAQRPRRPNARTMLRNIQKDIEAVQKQLKDAQEELGKAAKDLTRAQSDFKQSQHDVEHIRKTLTDRIGPKVGLQPAQSRLETAKAEHERASLDLAGSLRTNAEFQKLKMSLADAESRIAALKQDKSAGKQGLSQAAKDVQQARAAYQARLDGDPAVKPFRERLDAAEKHMNEVRAKYSLATKNDAELRQSESSLKQSKGNLDRAQAKVNGIQAQIVVLEDRLASNLALLGP